MRMYTRVHDNYCVNVYKVKWLSVNEYDNTDEIWCQISKNQLNLLTEQRAIFSAIITAKLSSIRTNYWRFSSWRHKQLLAVTYDNAVIWLSTICVLLLAGNSLVNVYKFVYTSAELILTTCASLHTVANVIDVNELVIKVLSYVKHAVYGVDQTTNYTTVKNTNYHYTISTNKSKIRVTLNEVGAEAEAKVLASKPSCFDALTSLQHYRHYDLCRRANCHLTVCLQMTSTGLLESWTCD